MQNWAQDLSRPVWSSVSRVLPGAQAELPADPQRQLDCVPGSRWRRDPRGCPPMVCHFEDSEDLCFVPRADVTGTSRPQRAL